MLALDLAGNGAESTLLLNNCPVGSDAGIPGEVETWVGCGMT